MYSLEKTMLAAPLLPQVCVYQKYVFCRMGQLRSVWRQKGDIVHTASLGLAPRDEDFQLWPDLRPHISIQEKACLSYPWTQLLQLHTIPSPSFNACHCPCLRRPLKEIPFSYITACLVPVSLPGFHPDPSHHLK